MAGHYISRSFHSGAEKTPANPPVHLPTNSVIPSDILISETCSAPKETTTGTIEAGNRKGVEYGFGTRRMQNLLLNLTSHARTTFGSDRRIFRIRLPVSCPDQPILHPDSVTSGSLFSALKPGIVADPFLWPSTDSRRFPVYFELSGQCRKSSLFPCLWG